jgi:hypothetical protein
MRSVTHRVLTTVAALLVAMGITVLLVQDGYWRTNADDRFFNTVPDTLWGIIQLLVAGFLLVALYARPRLLRPAAYVTAVVCLVWAIVELYPAFRHLHWSVPLFLLWLTMAAVSVLALPDRRAYSAP